MDEHGKIASRILGRRLRLDDENENNQNDESEEIKNQENKELEENNGNVIDLIINEDNSQNILEGNDVKEESVEPENEISTHEEICEIIDDTKEDIETKEDSAEDYTIDVQNSDTEEAKFDNNLVENIKTENIEDRGDDMGEEEKDIKIKENELLLSDDFEFDFDNDFEINGDSSEHDENLNKLLGLEQEQETKKYNVSVNELHYDNDFLVKDNNEQDFNMFSNNKSDIDEDIKPLINQDDIELNDNDDLLMTFKDENLDEEIILDDLINFEDSEKPEVINNEVGQNKYEDADPNDEFDFLLGEELLDDKTIDKNIEVKQELKYKEENDENSLLEIDIDEETEFQFTVEDNKEEVVGVKEEENSLLEIDIDEEADDEETEFQFIVEDKKDKVIEGVGVDQLIQEELPQETLSNTLEEAFGAKRCDILQGFEEITFDRIIQFFDGDTDDNTYNIIRRIEMQNLFELFTETWGIESFYRTKKTIDEKKIPNIIKVDNTPEVDMYETYGILIKSHLPKGNSCFILSDGIELDVTNHLFEIQTAKLNCKNVYLVVLDGAVVEQQDIDLANRYDVKIIKLDSHISTINENLEIIKNKL